MVIALICASFAGFSQGYIAMTPYKADFTKKTNGYDTTTNTDTSYLVAGVGLNLLGYQWQADVINTKVSGTVGGSVILQGSNDLTTWWTVKNYSSVITGVSDTTTLTNTTSQTFTYGLHSCDFKYVRLRAITSGTQTSYLRATLYYCPPLVKNLN